ncbi:hypothetical protein ABT369_01865 [Dactylosporangium sp. NPDC000244]|uniref:hypothetical protein n=1 Tax=Dactylosporangium sp. NPDC000244 TaxID=3154365 RepID=UPI00332DE3CA
MSTARSTPVSAGDRLWLAAAEELTPARSLARIDERAKQVVTSVSLVGTLVTGAGLVAGTRYDQGGWGRGLAIAAVGAAVLAVVTALGLLLMRPPRLGVALQDVAEVRRIYLGQFQRAYVAVAAGALLLLALLLAGAAAVVVLAGGPRAAGPELSVTVTGTGADTRVAVRAELHEVAAGATVRAEVTGVPSAGARVVLGRQVIVTRGAGPVTLVLDAVPAGGYAAVEVLVAAPGRTCTATIGPDATPKAACIM